MAQAKKLNYGVDAPRLVRNFFLFAVLLYGFGINFPVLHIGGTTTHVFTFCFITATICFIEGLMMFLYAKIGKFRHRDRMLNCIEWRGNETVLDIGTGLGLLIIGAAKRLTNGKSIGIDIWNQNDLSSNTVEGAKHNAEAEGVSDKVEIRNENIMSTDFTDNYFDVILSNLCIHNIKDKEGRQKACAEIYRILKPKGTAIISDFRNAKEYKTSFQQLGMTAETIGTYYFDTFPPLTIIKAVKK
ncbi:MAG: class I SAM-dependent methyltransferase [Bacteroidales bacterium]|jgi:ubiquinone/menaquinone biosynthesis C-methylase UbiE